MIEFTVAIPTFNSEARLGKCLDLIRSNNYDQSKIEIIIADGGSSDNTREIATKFGCLILDNERKLPEPGKSVCIDHATKEIIIFIDDDNFVRDPDFFSKMAAPFYDTDVCAAEPKSFCITHSDPPLSRYWAISGFNDPLMYFIGAYDRFSYLSMDWNGYSIKTNEFKFYSDFTLEKKIPTIGANGFAVRTSLIRKVNHSDLLDLDKVKALVDLGFSKFAKVNCCIGHTFATTMVDYYRKCKRKAKSFFGEVTYHTQTMNEVSKRVYCYHGLNRGILKFVISCCIIFPIIMQSIKLYWRTKDHSSFYHIPVCYITLYVYTCEVLKRVTR